MIRDPARLELPRGEARALEQRPGLVDPDVVEHAPLPGRAQRAERGAVPARRERAGVAVRERARARLEQLRGVPRHLPAALDLLAVDCSRALGGSGRRRIRSSAQPRLTAVGPARAQDARGLLEVLAARGRERVAVRGRDADRRRAADRERPDRLGHVGGGAASSSTSSSGAGAGRGGRRGRPRAGRSAQAPDPHRCPGTLRGLRVTRFEQVSRRGRRACRRRPRVRPPVDLQAVDPQLDLVRRRSGSSWQSEYLSSSVRKISRYLPGPVHMVQHVAARGHRSSRNAAWAPSATKVRMDVSDDDPAAGPNARASSAIAGAGSSRCVSASEQTARSNWPRLHRRASVSSPMPELGRPARASALARASPRSRRRRRRRVPARPGRPTGGRYRRQRRARSTRLDPGEEPGRERPLQLQHGVPPRRGRSWRPRRISLGDLAPGHVGPPPPGSRREPGGSPSGCDRPSTRSPTSQFRASAIPVKGQLELLLVRQALGSFVPGLQVLGLLLGEVVDCHAHRLELEARDLLVDLLRAPGRPCGRACRRSGRRTRRTAPGWRRTCP